VQTTLIRVALIDDHLMFMESLAERINREAGMEVVGTAANGDTGLRMILEAEPDVVVLDVDLPGRGAFDVVDEVTARLKNTKVIFLTGFVSDVFVEQALRLRAHGYLLKEEPLSVLIEGIGRVCNGDACYSRVVENRMVFDSKRGRYTVHTESQLIKLTNRQLEVLRHLAKGESVKEVARTLHLSEKSVDSHKYRIMGKLGIHDRVELARYAIREGLTFP
jgi:DNA-binding NarL/FixJ family response regulator